jgi:hypothetical protein
MSLVIDKRRLATSLAAFAAYALLAEAGAAGTVTDGRLHARRWIDRQDDLARALAAGAISGGAWHDEVNALAREVDAEALVAEVGRARLEAAKAFDPHDPAKRFVRFLDDDGRPQRLAYAAATFTFGPDSVITPHAHQHMASAHMVVEGRVRIRTFDRLAEDGGGGLILRPTRDEVAASGGAAAMTTAKDNVHWFTPVTAHAMTFDVIVDGLDKGQPDYVIQPVDPLGGERLADGAIRAPILSFEESMRRYTART